MKRDEVLTILRKQHKNLSEQFGVKKLYLFGSTARNEATSSSDVDLLVEFDPVPGLFEFIELQQNLESLLGCKVDLGTKRSIKDFMKEEILNEAILVS